tara:strand:+ start:3006 stop:3827 length:822 start_codon:yes stop_codon:yes gene_type:complete
MQQKIIACLFDFDGTLIPGNMQEPWLASYGITAKEFWDHNDRRRRTSKYRGVNLDAPHCYMNLLLEYADQGKISRFSNQDLVSFGSFLKPFDGLPEFFYKIKSLGKKHNVNIEHYVISTGLKEIIAGSSLGLAVDEIFACEYMEKDGYCVNPARTVDFIEKNRYLFEINKGVNKGRVKNVNDVIPQDQRRIPLSQMIYVGNTRKDVPCISVLDHHHGSSFIVYEQGNHNAKLEAEIMLKQGRIKEIYPANYSEDSDFFAAYSAKIIEIAGFAR